jgi:hypothetical protein
MKDMTPKEKVEELQKCANRHRDIHKTRMQVEYHVLVTALTFYAAATWAVVQYPSLNLPIRVAISIGFIALSFFASALLRGLHAANQVNLAIAENYEAEIVKLLEPQTNPIPERLQRRDYNHIRTVSFLVSNWGFQSATIIGFSLVGILLIWTK